MKPIHLAPVLGALLLTVSCASGDVEDAQAAADITLPDAPGVRVEVARVQPTDARRALDLPAELDGVNDAMLASPMGGHVDAVLVRRGETVRRGQGIARIDYGTRAAQLEIATAQAEQAEAELARARKLADGVSQSQLLAAETNARVTRANADIAKIQLGRALVTAPFSGRVADVMVDPGEIAGPGAPVARLVQDDPVLAKVSVSDRDIVHFTEGQAVTLRVQSLPGAFTGTVVTRGVAADPSSRTWQVEVEVPNPDGALMPGMLGRVSLERVVATDAIVIPQDWVVTRIDRSGVFLDKDGAAAWQDVTLAAFIGDQVVVSEGLSAGDQVVSAGHRELAEGDPLIVVRSGTCCTDGRVVW
ncbi:MAG: efflux RND transporter periplasmic adaptor subunit [Alphaproteobacteria bacterium]|nr:efflux RND transporter periplasmic adaptor subunit [Alphaproteobacteria bacterium]